MPEEQEFKIEVDLNPYGKKEIFKSVADFEKWLKVEKEYWVWPKDLRQIDQLASQAINLFQQRLNNLQGVLNNVMQNQNVQSNFRHFKDQLDRELKNYFTQRQLIHSSNPRAKFIKKIAEENPIHAAYILRYFTERSVDIGNQKNFEGAFAALLFEFNVKEASKSEGKALEELRGLWQEHLNTSRTELDTVKEKYDKLLAESEDQKSKQRGEFEKLIENSGKEQEGHIEKLTKRFKEIEDLYEKKLALHSAIKYWEEKAKSHLHLALGFTIFVLIAFSIVGFWLNDTMKTVIGNATLQNLEVWKIGQLLLIATIGVWVLRVLIRLLLSNIHLWSDAKERRTMLLTYLALHNEGKLPTDESRELILQVLFRPTSTGIVKDDAAPPFMAEWLKKTTGSE